MSELHAISPNGHTIKAEAVASATGWNLDTEAAEREWGGIGLGPVGQHRDSEALDLSNFAVVLADLEEQFPEHVAVARFGHFGFGWVEEIIWDSHFGPVADAVEAWESALADYPVASDEHYSETEWAENHPSEGECYSDDDDCPCEANLVHLDALNGTACNGDNFVPRNLTEDISEVTCEACDTAIAPSYATPGQGDLFAVAVA